MATAHTCYFPNGAISSRDTPCHDPGDGESACCAYSDICLSNNLCLGQTGAELISRGTCTDKSWGSPECPQYCADVSLNGGINIHLLDVGNDKSDVLFCCGQVEPSDNSCLNATKGSTSPFFIEAGLVIFNRTSGSTSPNNTNPDPVTLTASATATPLTVTSTATVSASASIYTGIGVASTSSSSGKESAIGAGVGVPLAVLLLLTLGLLWRERRQKQGLRRDVQTLEEKFRESTHSQSVELGTNENQSPRQLHGWNPNELEGWRAGEMEGMQPTEVANKRV